VIGALGTLGLEAHAVLAHGLLTLGATCFAGLAVGRILRADARPAAEPTLLGATALVIGLAFLSTGATARLLFPTVGTAAWLTACLGVLALGAFATRRDRGSTTGRLHAPPAVPGGVHRRRAFVALAIVGGAAAASIAVARLVRAPDGAWDAFGFWNLRARLFLRAPGDLALAFSPEMAATHPDYPLLIPGLVAFGGGLLGDGSTLPSAVVAALFGALAAVGLAGAVGPRRGREVAVVATLLFLAMPHVARQVSWRYADVPLAALLVLACGWLASAHERPEGARSAVVFVGVLGSIAAWTKNEGIVVLGALGASLVVRPPAGLPRRQALRRFAAGAAPMVAVLVAFKLALAPPNDLFEASSAGSVLDRLARPSRIVMIAAAWLDEVVSTARWNLLLPAVLLAAALGRVRGGATTGVAVVVASIAAAYVLVYVLTPHALPQHLDTSIERLQMHLVPALVLLAALRVAPPVRRTRPPPS